MDKHIKAELESLRNEVVANLKNIEGLVNQIDSKLVEEETTSCLSRCPDLSKLLDICKTVTLDPNTADSVKYQFESTVNAVYEQMSSIAVDRYKQGMAELIQMVKTMDSRIGKLASRSPMEEYWEIRFPGVRETVEQYLEDDGAVKPKPAAVDDAEVQRLIELATYTGKKVLPEATTDNAPDWAKDVDQKSDRQLWKEAAEWDEDAHALFCTMWNSLAKRRVEIMREVLAETVKHVQTYNYYNEHITVKNRDDVSKLLAKYDSLEQAKLRVIDVLENFDRATLDRIATDRTNETNWKLFYDWNKRLIAELEHIAIDIPQGMQVASSCNSMLRVMSKDREAEVFDPMIIDPNTFQVVPMKMPPDKLIAYRQRAYDNYMRDLQRAYEWETKSESA